MAELTLRREPQQRRSRERLEALLDAADRLLASDGYERFSTASVAAAANMPTPAVYRFFSDKDELARALILRHLERLDLAIQSAIGALQPDRFDAGTIITTVFAVYTDYMRQHRSQQILWFDRRIGPATVAEVHAYTRRTTAQFRELAISTGSLVPATTEVEALLLGEMMDRVLELAFRHDPLGDQDTLDRGLVLLRAAGAVLGRSAAPQPQSAA